MEEVVSDAEEQAAYEAARGIEPVKEPENPEPPQVEEQTEETPPPEPTLEDRVKEMQTQLSRISELEKQLEKRSRDDGGRYGALKQTIEQLQQKLSANGNTAANVSSVEDVLADVKEAFGEDDLYKSLKSAFTKALSSKGSVVDQDAIDRIVSERFATAEKAKQEEARTTLAELHPDYEDVLFVKNADGSIQKGNDGIPIGKPEYSEWQKTLSPTKLRRLKTSTDPYFAAEMLDEFKDWKAKELGKKEADRLDTTKPEKTKTIQNKSRLENAVLPAGSGASLKQDQVTEQEAYDAARAARRRK